MPVSSWNRLLSLSLVLSALFLCAAQAPGAASPGARGAQRLEGRQAVALSPDADLKKEWVDRGEGGAAGEERDELLRPWAGVDEKRSRPSWTIFAGVVAFLGGGLLLVVGYWNYVLQKMVQGRTASLAQELEERRKAEEVLKELTGRLEELIGERTAELEREIGDRRRSEEAALSSERLFRELFQNIADPVYISDASGRILAANQQAVRELGYPEEELLALMVHDLDVIYHNDERLAGKFREFTENSPLTFESVHRRKDGSFFPVEVNALLIDFNGSPCVMGVARNISERKRGEQERLKLEKQLLHAQKLESLGVLAGGIAHDFNNILTAIVGNADLALMRLAPDSPVRDNLQRIEKSALRAADLAKQMLAYSGKGRFLIERVDLNRLLEEMLNMLELSASKKVLLRLNLTRLLPTVEADASQLRQIAMNLILNASEAIGEKSGEITVSTGSLFCDRAYLNDAWFDKNLPEGLYVFLDIADNGCGMDRDTLSRIYDPFYTTKFTGRGLGMAAVLGIVRGHKGAIKIDSEPGAGTTIRILLPAGALPSEEPAREAEEDRWRGRGKVLLVDDEETVRAIGSEMLRELGFEVLTADDGREALETFRSSSEISFIILDLTMPHLDGEQTFVELRKLDPGVRVIMSSGYNLQEVNHRFAGKGLAGFIQKPYNLSALRAVVKQSLARVGATSRQDEKEESP